MPGRQLQRADRFQRHAAIDKKGDAPTVKGLRRIAIGIAAAGLLLASAAAYVANSGAGAPTTTAGRVIEGRGSSGLGPFQNPTQPIAAGQSQVFYISGTVSGP